MNYNNIITRYFAKYKFLKNFDGVPFEEYIETFRMTMLISDHITFPQIVFFFCQRVEMVK